MRVIKNYMRAGQYTTVHISLGVIVFTTLLYILFFLPLFRIIALPVIALTIIPVIISGGSFGWWGGLIAGILSLVVNYVLLSLINGASPSLISDPYFWIAHTVFIIVGVSVGYLQSILMALRQEMHIRTLAETKLTYLSTHDPLTDLANQSLFHDRLNHAISRAERNSQGLAVLYMDLDSFKSINDAFGHEFGDQVLLVVADRLKNSVRASDTVARLGGDAFAVILENISSDEDISRVSQKILDAAGAEIRVQEQSAYLTTSCGISRFPTNGKSPNNLIRQADIAMTEVKKRGGNGYGFSSFSL